jgi:hypothetical protein
VTLKVVPKAACDSKFDPKAGLVCRENQPLRENESQKQKFLCGFWAILQLENFCAFQKIFIW